MKPSQAKQIVEAWANNHGLPLIEELDALIADIAAAPCEECAEKAARIQQQDIFIRNDHDGECVDNEIAQAARIATLESEYCDLVSDIAIELDDPRMRYVTAQISRVVWERAKKIVEGEK